MQLYHYFMLLATGFIHTWCNASCLLEMATINTVEVSWQFPYCALYCKRETNEFEHNLAREFLDQLRRKFHEHTEDKYNVIDDWSEHPGKNIFRFRLEVLRKSQFVLVVYTQSIMSNVFDDVLLDKAFEAKVKAGAFIPITLDGSHDCISDIASMQEPLVFSRDSLKDVKSWETALKLLTNPDNLKLVCGRNECVDKSASTSIMLVAARKQDREGESFCFLYVKLCRLAAKFYLHYLRMRN